MIFTQYDIYLKRMNSVLIRKNIILLLILFAAAGFTVSAQEKSDGEGTVKPVLAIVPVFGKDVPVYIPKVIDKLMEAKIEKIDTYRIMPKEELQKFFDDNGIVLKTVPRIEDLNKYADKIGADQVLFGKVSPQGEGYSLETRVYDAEKKEVLIADKETAANLKGLDGAVEGLTRKIVKKIFPPEVVTEVEKTLDQEKETKKEEQVKENINTFSDLVEKDPEKALELFDEPARTALEDKVKEQVVQGEIQNLFEEEKARKAREKKRKWQHWTAFTLETLDQFGNLFGSLAEYERVNSLLYWNKYMNNMFIDDPYENYRRSVDDFGGFLAQKYVFSGLGNLGLGIGINYMLDDAYSFTAAGKYLFSAFYTLNALGDAASALTDQLSFISLRKYLEYAHATSDFTAKYNAYRDSLIFPTIARYATYAFWGAGYTGMVIAALLPGERSPMIVSEKARRFLSWGSGLAGLGNIVSGLALNYRGKAEESWITETSPSGTIGDNLGDIYTLVADILSYTSYGLLIGGSALSAVGLLSSAEEGTDNGTGKDNLSFNVVPSAEGTSLVVRLRME